MLKIFDSSFSVTKKLNQGIFWTTKIGATRIGHNGSDSGVRTFMLSD